jgi:DNA-binding NarL/FixJ family response regulator
MTKPAPSVDPEDEEPDDPAASSASSYSGAPDGPGTIRVFLVDDQQLVRGGFRMLIEAQPDMTVVGEAGDGAQAVSALTRGGVSADVVLMDIRMPVLDGVEATRRLVGSADPRGGEVTPGSLRPDDSVTAPPVPAVLVLTTFDLDEYVYAALRAGASGFLLKDARPDELLSAIRAVASGDAVVAPSATRRLLDHVLHALPSGPAEPDPRLELLTAREHEVLLQVAAGASNAEIAAELYMAEATVKTHIGHLLTKLECRDRVGLVVFAYTTGLVGER